MHAPAIDEAASTSGRRCCEYAGGAALAPARQPAHRSNCYRGNTPGGCRFSPVAGIAQNVQPVRRLSRRASGVPLNAGSDKPPAPASVTWDCHHEAGTGKAESAGGPDDGSGPTAAFRSRQLPTHRSRNKFGPSGPLPGPTVDTPVQPAIGLLVQIWVGADLRLA